MGNANNGNRTAVDAEHRRMDNEFASPMRSVRGDTKNPRYRSPTSVGTLSLADRMRGRTQPTPNDAVEPEYNEGDFGRGRADELRSEVLNSYRMNSNGISASRTGGDRMGGSSYGGDVNWTDAAMGNTGSARGTYEDFSRGGGVDVNAMRRANTVIPSFYDAYKRNAQRRSNVQGGYSPGFDAQAAEMGRQAGREGHESSLRTEGDIARLVQSGRMQGAAGLTGLGAMESDMNRFNTSGRFSAEEGNANRRQGASQFDRGFDEDSRRWESEFGEGNRRFNAQGLAGVYGMDNDNYRNNIDDYFRGAAGRSGNAQSLIYNRTEPQSNFDKYAGMAVGIGGSLLGSFSGPRRRPQVTSPWERGGGG